MLIHPTQRISRDTISRDTIGRYVQDLDALHQTIGGVVKNLDSFSGV